MKTLTFILFLAAFWLLVDYNNRQAFRKCLEASEYTDTDICECLHRHGLEDELLCN